MITKEEAYQKIATLVEHFGEHIAVYKQGNYNETQTRREYIDPFFKALGWDIDNEQGLAEAYKEVIHEDKIKIGGATKAPDYCFTIYGQKKFFVEAKKPSVDIKDDNVPAYQLRRYGWSARLPVSVITDFEEFSVYDCTKRPKQDEKASASRIRYILYTDYLKEFDFIWDTFSKEGVLKGRFDKYVQADTHKKGTATVDKEFLQTLEELRHYLAKGIAYCNKDLTEDEMNFLVQMNLDRIIFLRIAEDRGVEQYSQLKSCIQTGNFYQNLHNLYNLADQKYNSGLFDFKKDKLTAAVSIDNKVLKEIINELYYPHSPYEFSVMPVEILGNAYEQFLGKVIRLTPGHIVKIEEKPEVRKAGGVYYTPQYIVEYIVKNTLGKLIENKTPEEISEIKIVDPACGSGSFLIGAYQYLLEYHSNYYTSHSKYTKVKSRSPFAPDGSLTTAEKKRILLNNIYGVDIDTQAVEVTKLSLLLKTLDGETNASIQNEWQLFHDRVLPNLDDNIKCGNSLIDVDFYDNQIDFAEEKKIKPFSWQRAFPDIFKQGGFDVVLGNPPWGADFNEESLSYLRNKNKEIIVRMIDSFMYFVYKSYKLLKPQGSFGMILPDVLFYQTDNLKLREYILNHSKIEALLNLGNVFENVTRPSCIIIFTNSHDEIINKIVTGDLTNFKKENKHTELNKIENFESVLQKELIEIPNYLFVTTNAKHFLIVKKIKRGKVLKLAEFVDEDGIQRGVSPDLKEAFLVTSEQVKQFGLEKTHLRNVMTGGKQVKRFFINYPDLQLIYTKRDTSFKTIPNICCFINQFKAKITCKEVIEGKHSIYALHRAREEKIFTKPEKLVGVITEDEIVVSIDKNKTFVTDGLYIFGVKDIDIKYLMGILNSKLFVFLYRLTTMEGNRALAQVKPTVLAEMPIRVVENINSDKKIHDEIIKLVDQLLILNKDKSESRLQTATEQLQGKIDYCESRINQLVYELYGLTEEEKKIVEGK